MAINISYKDIVRLYTRVCAYVCRYVHARAATIGSVGTIEPEETSNNYQ